jgi:hypothetical protein
VYIYIYIYIHVHIYIANCDEYNVSNYIDAEQVNPLKYLGTTVNTDNSTDEEIKERTWAMASTFLRFLYHTQRHITVGRTPLDE